MCSANPERSATFLQEVFGFEAEGEENGRIRLAAAGDAPGRRVDLYCGDSHTLGRMSAGVVHHVASELQPRRISWNGASIWLISGLT